MNPVNVKWNKHHVRLASCVRFVPFGGMMVYALGDHITGDVSLLMMGEPSPVDGTRWGHITDGDVTRWRVALGCNIDVVEPEAD